MLRSIVVASAAVLSGCASSGNPIDHQRAAAFTPGRTTIEEVEHALGTPTSVMQVNGRTTVVYVHATARMNPLTVVPIVGLFAGGVTTNADSVGYSFDRNGVMVATQ